MPRPAIIHASETWVLKESMKIKLFVTESKMLRRILGSIKGRDGTWRVKTNYEVNNLVRYKIKLTTVRPKWPRTPNDK